MPEDTPVTNPVVALTVATAVLVLLHVPPNVPSVNTEVWPTHIVVVPPIAPGIGLTVTVIVAEQPDGKT